jgi:hypothetical protein
MCGTGSVQLGTVSDLDRLSTALGAAFDEDPVFEWLIPDGGRRRQQLVRFFRLELERVVLPTGAAPSGPARPCGRCDARREVRETHSEVAAGPA